LNVPARAGLATLLVLCAACEGRPQSAAADKSNEKKHSGPKVAVLDLTSGAPEEADGGFLGLPSKHKSFDELVLATAEIEKDRDAKGVLVKLGGASIGMARSEEIGDRLSKLKEKFPIYCHADGYTNATLLAASRGCSKIFVSPSGEVEAIGVAAQIVYLHKLLAEELKVDIDFLQVGKFKGAEEPITRDGPSAEARESLESVLRDIRARWIDRIKTGRDKTPNVEDAIEDGPYGAQKAKAVGLVDDVRYVDDVLDDLKKDTHAVRDEVFFGHGAEADRPDDLDELVRTVAGESDSYGPVALVRATGSISMSGGGMFGSRGITDHDLAPLLLKLEKDDDVKAVVLRIDSPGGSALASDLLWHRLMKIRAKKPLIVSVGDMAASGGYYLASTANVVFAEPTSIVGSIGVVGGKLGIAGTLGQYGVHAVTFPASPKPGAAARAAYMSAFTPWDDPTRARILESMTEVYDLFLSRVSEGRGIPVTTVAESAEGRIFSGRQGKERKLVDELGGLSDAIAKAKEMAKLPSEARVVAVMGKPGLFGLGGDGADERASASRARAVAAAALPLSARAALEADGDGIAARIGADVAPFAENMLLLAEGERMLTAMPFALEVR
jgi:protease-4